MSDDSGVKKQVEGVCTEISEKNGWTTFSIDKGTQYPERLSTKLEAIIKAGREAGQNKAVWTFNETEGGPNPNKPGQNYKNRRLEKVEVGGQLDLGLAQATSSGSAAGGGSPGGGYARTGDERVSIERQTLVKAAITALPAGAVESTEAWFGLLDRLDDWMGRGRAGAAAAASPPAEAPAEAAASPAAVDPGRPSDEPPYVEDDIPF